MANPTPFFNKKDVFTLIGVVASVVLPKLFLDVEEEVYEQTIEVDIPEPDAEQEETVEVIDVDEA